MTNWGGIETIEKTSEYHTQPNSETLKALHDLLIKLDKIYSLGFDLAEYYLKKGRQLVADREYDKAIEAYQKVIEINPKYDAIFNNLGNAYHNKKEYDKAIEAYQKAIEINPKLDVLYSNLGVAYNDKKEHSRAIEAYEKAIEINPKFDKAYSNIGNAYNDKNEYDKAIEAYQKAIEINPKYDKAYNNIGNAYHNKKEYDKAIEAYQKAIEINPKLDMAYYNLGIAYGNKNEYDKAIEAYQKAIEINPKGGVAYTNLLESQLIHKNYMSSEAVKSFKEYIKDKESLKRFGMLEILQNLKDEESFEEEYERWVKEHGDTKANWGFNGLDSWAETFEEGKKELIKKAIEAFNPYFNN